MAKLKGELQADGDILHPHTSADVTFMADGTTVEQRLANIKLYFSLADVNASYTPATPLRTVLTAMAINSELHCNITATSVDYPETGILHIVKTAANTASLTLDSATKRRIANVTPANIEQIFGGGGGIKWKICMNDDDFQTLETEIAETKKSVSDGKTLVAAAITRKDVTTAATDTFAKMASNIDSITTVQQGTADATAVAADLLINKTAYKNGLKLIGTMANNGAVASAIAGGVLKQGYTAGGAIANLVASNVLQGVNIGGIIGSLIKGKQVATGVGSINDQNKLVITSLPFKPTMAVGYVYIANTKAVVSFIDSYSNFNVYSESNSTGRYSGQNSLSANSFTLMCNGLGSGTSIRWYAIE